MTRIQKDPESDLDYIVDWTKWLDGDTISTSTWIVPSDSGLAQHDASITDGAKTKVWLRGGTSRNTAYSVVNRIVTAAGRKEDFTLLVTVADK